MYERDQLRRVDRMRMIVDEEPSPTTTYQLVITPNSEHKVNILAREIATRTYAN